MPLDLKITLISVFVQVLLTFMVTFRMASSRIAALQKTELKLGDVALSTTAYPEKTRQISNNLSNQFEFPVLFYTAVCLAAALEATTMIMAIAAVGFVVFRVVHHLIHVGANHVRHRFAAFSVSLLMLGIMWLALGLRLSGVI